jgi:hypothetical protein
MRKQTIRPYICKLQVNLLFALNPAKRYTVKFKTVAALKDERAWGEEKVSNM